MNSKNNDRRFRAINAVSEKQRRRKVYILVAFGESFPTINNMPTCDEPMGLRWYSTVLPINPECYYPSVGRINITYQVTYQVRSHLDPDKNPVPVGDPEDNDLEGCRTSVQKEPHLHTVYLLQMLLERVN